MNPTWAQGDGPKVTSTGPTLQRCFLMHLCGLGTWSPMISKAGQLGLDLVWVGDGLVTDLVQGVRGVGDQLAQKDLLVGVESVNNQTSKGCLNFSVCTAS